MERVYKFNRSERLYYGDNLEKDLYDYDIFRDREGRIHRSDGPAVIGPHIKKWYRHGKLHRVEGPAVKGDRSKEYHQDGLLHNPVGPAMVMQYDWCGTDNSYTTTVYARYGKLHNVNGPAIDTDKKLLKVFAMDGKLVDMKEAYKFYSDGYWNDYTTIVDSQNGKISWVMKTNGYVSHYAVDTSDIIKNEKDVGKKTTLPLSSDFFLTEEVTPWSGYSDSSTRTFVNRPETSDLVYVDSLEKALDVSSIINTLETENFSRVEECLWHNIFFIPQSETSIIKSDGTVVTFDDIVRESFKSTKV